MKSWNYCSIWSGSQSLRPLSFRGHAGGGLRHRERRRRCWVDCSWSRASLFEAEQLMRERNLLVAAGARRSTPAKPRAALRHSNQILSFNLGWSSSISVSGRKQRPAPFCKLRKCRSQSGVHRAVQQAFRGRREARVSNATSRCAGQGDIGTGRWLSSQSALRPASGVWKCDSRPRQSAPRGGDRCEICDDRRPYRSTGESRRSTGNRTLSVAGRQIAISASRDRFAKSFNCSRVCGTREPHSTLTQGPH